MANLTDSTNLTGTITLSKATGTKVTLDTDHKYLTKDIELTINAPVSTVTSSGTTVSYTNGWINAGSTTITDNNLVASNIKKNITIFGVTGSYESNIIITDTLDSGGGTIRTITTSDEPIMLQQKINISPSTTAITVSPDTGYFGLTSVTINGEANLIASNIKNGVSIFGVTGSYSGSSNTPSLQAKTNINPTESSQTITPDNGYDGLSSVQINAISSTYVGSGITSRSSADLTASGNTVTVPAGYYSSQASKAVSSLTLPTSVDASATSGYTSKATISRSTSDQYINIGTGYNSTGGYYKINAVANGSATGPSSVSGSSASVNAGTNTLTFSKTISITPVVSAGYISSGTSTNATVSLSASINTKEAATYTPTTTNQTIASGTYLVGAQTISGDANLIAENIKSGVSIFGVTGSYEGSGGGSVTQDANGYIILPSTGSGSGGGSGSGVSATQHTIHLEFSDSTDTNISVYYDDSFISTIITDYKPSTYNNKMIVLAELDNVTWYDSTAIPIGVELIDYTAIESDKAIDSDGNITTAQWYFVSDYTPVDPSMTFSYTAALWYHIGVYDENKQPLRTVYPYMDADITVDPDDNNIGHGILSGSELTGAKYVRLSSTHQSSPGMSLIRTS